MTRAPRSAMASSSSARRRSSTLSSSCAPSDSAGMAMLSVRYRPSVTRPSYPGIAPGIGAYFRSASLRPTGLPIVRFCSGGRFLPPMRLPKEPAQRKAEDQENCNARRLIGPQASGNITYRRENVRNLKHRDPPLMGSRRRASGAPAVTVIAAQPRKFLRSPHRQRSGQPARSRRSHEAHHPCSTSSRKENT